ncbi:Signal transduction histidine kinase [Agreia bicolorata]|uniref:histidine kinase n=1 Tax=Agreia bicolorata TaxID=110935 RepID=A0A1T4WSH9_9MICO|nr:histidine kinase [Agreia bicolorata]SKA80332.1 Signal transduction histidine kinase [Agreia bicolorata]
MNAVYRLFARTPPIVIDLILAGLALTDGLLSLWRTTDTDTIYTIVAAGGLLLRRRVPYLALALTLPSLFFGSSNVAAIVALYTVAALSRSRAGVLIAAAVVFCGNTSFWAESLTFAESVPDIIYSLMVAAGPTALGLLTRTYGELARRVSELSILRDQERERISDEVRAAERVQLAREMHDVVSHQVSLISVQAGALQVRSADPEVKEASLTIRRLASRTLEELRQMVVVLRGPADEGVSLTPQPTLASVDELIAGSGLDVETSLALPANLSPAVQRTLYRAVQEGLTNVRKHAPGARVTVRGAIERNEIVVTVTNSAPTQPALDLPSARHGLLGLAERADIHGGSSSAGATPDGGFELVLRLPR